MSCQWGKTGCDVLSVGTDRVCVLSVGTDRV